MDKKEKEKQFTITEPYLYCDICLETKKTIEWRTDADSYICTRICESCLKIALEIIKG